MSASLNFKMHRDNSVTFVTVYRDFNYSLSRSSHPEVFFKKGVLRNFAKFTGKHLCQSHFFNKDVGHWPGHSPVRHFLSNFYLQPSDSPSKTMKNVF